MVREQLRCGICCLLALGYHHGRISASGQAIQPIERPRFEERLAAPFAPPVRLLAVGQRSDFLLRISRFARIGD